MPRRAREAKSGRASSGENIIEGPLSLSERLRRTDPQRRANLFPGLHGSGALRFARGLLRAGRAYRRAGGLRHFAARDARLCGGDRAPVPPRHRGVRRLRWTSWRSERGRGDSSTTSPPPSRERTRLSRSASRLTAVERAAGRPGEARCPRGRAEDPGIGRRSGGGIRLRMDLLQRALRRAARRAGVRHDRRSLRAARRHRR